MISARSGRACGAAEVRLFSDNSMGLLGSLATAGLPHSISQLMIAQANMLFEGGVLAEDGQVDFKGKPMAFVLRGPTKLYRDQDCQRCRAQGGCQTGGQKAMRDRSHGLTSGPPYGFISAWRLISIAISAKAAAMMPS
jgi:hypothetical protein